MKSSGIGILAFLFGCVVLFPFLFAGSVEDRRSMMKELATRAKEKDAIKVTDDLSLAPCDMFSDENECKTYLPVVVDKTADVACEVQSVFVFNTFGEGFELQQSVTYGEHSGKRSSRIALWSTDLLAGGDYTPYVYWSTGVTGGIIRLAPQSLPAPNTTRLLTGLRITDKKGEELATCIRSCGNLRVKDAVANIVDALTNAVDRQVTEACLVAIAKVGLPDDKFIELLNERKVRNANALLAQFGRLRKAFRADATVADLLEVSTIENSEAKTWVVLRLVYLGEKDLVGKIPLGMSWNRLMRFRLAVTALVDVRKQAQKE